MYKKNRKSAQILYPNYLFVTYITLADFDIVFLCTNQQTSWKF
jgi:hypothetical protein